MNTFSINRYGMAVGVVMILAMLATGYQSHAQSPDKNSVHTYIPQVKVKDEVTFQTIENDVTKVNSTIVYYDGLGRPLQTVNYKASPSGNDVVIPVAYDNFGLEIIKYEPYVSGEANGNFKPDPTGQNGGYTGSAHYNFYNAENDKIENDAAPYSVTLYEASPLSRVLKQGMPGTEWQPNSDVQNFDDKTIKHRYGFNITGEVLLWQYDVATHRVNAKNQSNAMQYFLRNTLHSHYTYNEHNKVVITYTDNAGRTVLKRVQAGELPKPVNDQNFASTYYIYDDAGNLRTVLSPEASNRLTPEYHNAEAGVQESFLSRWAYRYKYDSRHRIIETQIPGAAPVYMVYDKRDRLVLTQNGVQRGKSPKEWIFTKYDGLNKPILTGIYKDTENKDQAGMQQKVNNFYTSAPVDKWFEDRVPSGQIGLHGYTDRSFPTGVSENDFLTISYYDDYSFKSLFNSAEFNFRKNELPLVNGLPAQVSNEFLSVRGLATGSKIKSLSTNTWLRSVNYYDDHYRPVQQITENLKGHTVTTSVFDFAGKIRRQKTSLFLGQPVIWKNITGAQVQDDILVSTGSGVWAAGASSSQTLAAGSDGWIEITVVNSSPAFAFGLSLSDVDTHFKTIQYAWNINGTTLKANENGLPKGSGVNAFPGDVLRVERIDGIIYYKRNGMIVHTSETPSSTLLIADASFYNTGSSFSKARLSNTFSSVSLMDASYYITKRMDYDHAGRLTNTWHQVKGSDEILLSKNIYNELGQLIDKKLHSTVVSGADAKQSIDYRYNIRGWLTSINNSKLSIDGQTNDDANDYFGMNLNYEKPDPNLGSKALFDGNISGMKWSSNLGLGEVIETGYNFSYDAMNRLTVANSKMNKNNAWQGGYYDETIPKYDLNGNILKLQRKGDNGALIDDLTYSYGAGAEQSNQLRYVTDAVTDKAKGFVDGNPNAGDFTYDDNGNLITDKNKAITVPITYNHLNLPIKIFRSYSNINYFYDASGTKLAQLTSFGTNHKLTEYIGPWVFENNELQFIQHEEGRIVVTTKKTLYTSSADAATGFTGTANATLKVATINGEKYVQMTPAVGVKLENVGIAKLGNVYTVKAGERYVYRMKGYSTGTAIANLFVKGNTNEILVAGAALPRLDVNQSWVESAFTIPAGVTQITIGVRFNTQLVATSDNTFFVNDVELYKQNTAAPEYQYNLKDHLGNVRLTFTTNEETESASATMEAADKASESEKFLNYDRVRIITNAPLFDHTNGAGNGASIRLSGNANEKTGLIRSLAVMPGDVIKTEVYAKYVDQNSSNWTAALTSLMSALTTAKLNTVIDGSAYSTNASNPFTFTGLNSTERSTGLGPKAFLNYLVFDKDFKLIAGQSGYKRLSEIPKEKGQDVAHEKLETKITITEQGYVYIYLSNEETSPVEVYFDDFQVTQIKSPVIAAQDYYPFGLTFNSYSRENSTPNKFKFQGQEHVDDLGLNWDSYRYRNHQPDIGRFFSIDPMASAFYYNSPYAFSENKVTTHREMEGLEAFFIHGTTADKSMWKDDMVKFIMRELQPYVNADQDVNTGFNWNDPQPGLSWVGADKMNWIGNSGKKARAAAARQLVAYIIKNHKKGQSITLVTHSHGGNVAIQAARILFEKHNTSVNIIGFNTPAYNGASDRENPWDNFGVDEMLHFFTEGDNVADGAGWGEAENKYGGLVGSNVHQIQLSNPLKSDMIGYQQHKFDNVNWQEVLSQFGSMMNNQSNSGGDKKKQTYFKGEKGHGEW